MSRERILFFDLDDTLYRRSAPFVQACRTFFGENGVFLQNREKTFKGVLQDCSDGWLRQAYVSTQKRCEEVYFPTRRGEITADEGFIYRFQKGFSDVGVSLTKEEALLFRDAYQEAQKNISADPVIRELLPKCKEVFGAIGVITNGSGEHQREKLAAIDLFDWIDPSLVVISGEIGIDKPAEGIFRYAETLTGKGREELIYVGDSMENDVQAAENAGWQAVWWNWSEPDASIREIFKGV